MRILLASYFYLPHVGGLWTYADLLQKRLQKLGHKVDIFGHAPGMQKYHMVGTGKSIEKSKIKDPIYDNLIKYYIRQRNDVAEWIRWREIERYSYEAAAAYFGLEKYDLIHAQDIVSTRALSRIKPKHIPLLSTIHGCLATEYIHSGEVKHKPSQEWSYAWTEEYFGATSSQLTIVPTHWLKDLMATEFYVPDQQIRVIPYGMDIASFLAKADKGEFLNVPPSKKLLVCPARLVPVKGHKTLLEALALLKKERNDWVCWLLGNGPLRAGLVMEVQRLNLHNDVIFMGDRKDVASILKLAHVMVLPSLQDNQPFSVMEAQISGKAVVVSDAGGIPEMVTHGETGLIFPKGDSVTLYTHLKTLLDDDFLRLRMGKNAKQWGSAHWSLEKMTSQTLEIYEQIAGSTVSR